MLDGEKKFVSKCAESQNSIWDQTVNNYVSMWAETLNTNFETKWIWVHHLVPNRLLIPIWAKTQIPNAFKRYIDHTITHTRKQDLFQTIDYDEIGAILKMLKSNEGSQLASEGVFTRRIFLSKLHCMVPLSKFTSRDENYSNTTFVVSGILHWTKSQVFSSIIRF